MKKFAFVCPKTTQPLQNQVNELVSSTGEKYPLIKDGKIPVFYKQEDDVNEYTLKNAAEIHENALHWLFKTFNVSEVSLRQQLISRLALKKSQKVLVTGMGAGNDIPFIAQLVGKDGEIVGIDIAAQMVEEASDRISGTYDLDGYNIELCVGDAAHLPCPDNYFDAVFHFGGINLYRDIRRGINEMNRVVKEGGKVVFGDEGVAPWLRHSELYHMLVQNNSLYSYEAPITSLPSTARDVNCEWIIENCFYLISFSKGSSELEIDTEVPHKGYRGGSVNTRYYGKLEGISPSLKEVVYDKAQQQGKSRVEFLEELLIIALERK